jgi:hypothetical protein
VLRQDWKGVDDAVLGEETSGALLPLPQIHTFVCGIQIALYRNHMLDYPLK